MALKKALYYGAIAIAILIAVSVLVSIVSTILSLAWAVVSAAISLAVLLGLLYVAYRTGKWLFGSDEGTATADGLGSASSTEPADPKEQLRTQYVEGRISEEEFERRMERELETESIDRELERER